MSTWGHCEDCGHDVLIPDIDERPPLHECGTRLLAYTDRCDICRRSIPEGLGARLCDLHEGAAKAHGQQERNRMQWERDGRP